MKRITALLMLLSLLLSGCADRIKDPVTFYYVRSGYEEDMSHLLESEQREASGHREDLAYLMALYLMGPADEDLQSPIPRGTSIFSAVRSGSSVMLHLSDTSDSMTDAQFILACSCLTMTCLELTDAEQVTINSGDRSVTMSKSTLLLYDLTTGAKTEEDS